MKDQMTPSVENHPHSFESDIESTAAADEDSDAADDSDASSALYRLASDYDSVSDSDMTSDDDDDTIADSDVDESDWQKVDISAADIDFDAVRVVPSQLFSFSDGPVDFFARFFDDELWELLVEQTNLYATLA